MDKLQQQQDPGNYLQGILEDGDHPDHVESFLNCTTKKDTNQRKLLFCQQHPSQFKAFNKARNDKNKKSNNKNHDDDDTNDEYVKLPWVQATKYNRLQSLRVILEYMKQHSLLLMLINEKELKSQRTALSYAAWNGSIEAIQLLFEYCCADHIDVNIQDGIEPTLVDKFRGWYDPFKMKLDDLLFDLQNRKMRLCGGYYRGRETRYKNAAKINSTIGGTPLFWATARNHLGVANVLIELYGADVNISNLQGWTPLVWAAERGNLEMAKLFIYHGANVNSGLLQEVGSPPFPEWINRRNDVFLGDTDLDESLRYMSCLIVPPPGEDHTPTRYKGWTPLWWAVRGRYLDVARLLLNHGADVSNIDGILSWFTNHRGKNNRNYYEIVELLIENGADVNIPLNGNTVRVGKLEIMKLLFKKGARIRDEKVSKDCLKPAIRQRNKSVSNFELVKLLFDNGAQVYGGCIVDAAARSSRYGENVADMGVLELLIRRGGNVNENDAAPLLHACGDGNTRLAEFLIRNGANVDGGSRSPLIQSVQPLSDSSEDLVLLLLKHGADPLKEAITDMHPPRRESPLEYTRRMIHCQNADPEQARKKACLNKIASIMEFHVFSMIYHDQEAEQPTLFSLINKDEETGDAFLKKIESYYI